MKLPPKYKYPQQIHVFVLSIFVLATLTCTNIIAQDVSTAEAPAKKAENIPDGINDNFLNPEMDPEEWIKRFEIESREVFACREQILRAIELAPGMAVADIGAGTGLYMAALSHAVGAEGKIFAVDISPNFVKHLRKRSRDEALDNVEVVLCSDKDVNLKPNSVDRAFICDVYHHFEYPENSLASIYRAMRDGGKLILVDFYREKEGLEDSRNEWLSGHIRASQEVFKQEIMDAGFKFDQEVEVDGFKENYLLRFSK